jgi:hypothetical protein
MQGFAMILGIYAFCRSKVEGKKYLIASAMMIVVLYVMRLLPIQAGIHTILDLILCFLIAVLYLKMPAFNAIRSILIMTVLLLLTELLNVFSMTQLLGKARFDALMADPVSKYIVGLPAAVVFAGIILVVYLILKKKNNKNGKKSA